MFDDDVQWISTKTEKQMNGSEWILMYEIYFKSELSTFEPALMSIPTSKEHSFFNPNHCESKSCSIYHHDGIAVWAHRELIYNKMVFPLYEKLDDLCAWESQRILWNTAYVMYFNHILMFTDFYATNPVHRDYPKTWVEGQKATHKYLKNVFREVFHNDWIYNNYYNYTDPEDCKWFEEELNTFVNHPQYKLVGYPQKKKKKRYDDNTVFNNTKP
eukprot:181787_1